MTLALSLASVRFRKLLKYLLDVHLYINFFYFHLFAFSITILSNAIILSISQLQAQ